MTSAVHIGKPELLFVSIWKPHFLSQDTPDNSARACPRAWDPALPGSLGVPLVLTSPALPPWASPSCLCSTPDVSLSSCVLSSVPPELQAAGPFAVSEAHPPTPSLVPSPPSCSRLVLSITSFVYHAISQLQTQNPNSQRPKS